MLASVSLLAESVLTNYALLSGDEDIQCNLPPQACTPQGYLPEHSTEKGVGVVYVYASNHILSQILASEQNIWNDLYIFPSVYYGCVTETIIPPEYPNPDYDRQ